MSREFDYPFGGKSLAWQFQTSRFTIQLWIEDDVYFVYDGDDPDGEIAKKLEDGDYVAFDSEVKVLLDGHMIASDSLGGSVYGADTVHEFWTMHRSPDPMHRNCSIRRKKKPGTIGHYFPDMVRSAIEEARKYVANMSPPPRLRKAA